jgi:DHA1 family tetracycline resistance protein-like MFS transporter
MAFGLGFVFGPALGGFAVRLGPAAPGLAAAALSFTAFLWALIALPETRPVEGAASRVGAVPLAALRRSFANPVVAPLLVLTLVATTAFSSFEVSLSQHLHGRFGFDPSHVAFVFVAIGLTSAFTQGLLVRRLAARFGEARLVAAGASLLVAGFAAMVFASERVALIGSVVLIALGAGLLNPSLSSLVSRRAARHSQGEVLGAFQGMGSLGRIVGPFWGENAYLRFHAPGAYGTAAVLEALALILGLRAASRENAPRPEGP